MNQPVNQRQDRAIADGSTALPPTSTAPTSTAPAPATIETWLVERLAACLDAAIDDIDPDVPFESYGLDSAEAVELSGELEDWLQRRVSSTLLYDYPTIAALAKHLGGGG